MYFFHTRQIFAIFAIESPTAKISTRKLRCCVCTPHTLMKWDTVIGSDVSITSPYTHDIILIPHHEPIIGESQPHPCVGGSLSGYSECDVVPLHHGPCGVIVAVVTLGRAACAEEFTMATVRPRPLINLCVCVCVCVCVAERMKRNHTNKISG